MSEMKPSFNTQNLTNSDTFRPTSACAKFAGLPESMFYEDVLTHNQPHFDALKVYRFRKHCEKRRNCL